MNRCTRVCVLVDIPRPRDRARLRPVRGGRSGTQHGRAHGGSPLPRRGCDGAEVALSSARPAALPVSCRLRRLGATDRGAGETDSRAGRRRPEGAWLFPGGEANADGHALDPPCRPLAARLRITCGTVLGLG